MVLRSVLSHIALVDQDISSYLPLLCDTSKLCYVAVQALLVWGLCFGGVGGVACRHLVFRLYDWDVKNASESTYIGIWECCLCN